MQHPDRADYLDLIERARSEDLGSGDVTSEVSIPEGKAGHGALRFREKGVLCGMGVVAEVLHAYDAVLELHEPLAEGTEVAVGATVGQVAGPLRSVLAAERVVLNFLQRLCGIATATRRYVEAVAGTGAKIYDTRKTTPGWRRLEKYAVRCGGGRNHRQGLYDGVLIKDNHLAAWGGADLQDGLEAMVAAIRKRPEQPTFIEVEVDGLDQLNQVLLVEGVDMVLLDNMSMEDMARAVKRRDAHRSGKKVLLEASGNIGLDNVSAVARTGVERISVGGLTHSVKSLDIGLDLS